MSLLGSLQNVDLGERSKAHVILAREAKHSHALRVGQISPRHADNSPFVAGTKGLPGERAGR